MFYLIQIYKSWPEEGAQHNGIFDPRQYQFGLEGMSSSIFAENLSFQFLAKMK